MLHEKLRVGMTISTTGRMVIAHHQIIERVPKETFATWVALCVNEDEYHPYVVWNVIARPEGFIAETGDYFFDIEEAAQRFAQRARLKSTTA